MGNCVFTYNTHLVYTCTSLGYSQTIYASLVNWTNIYIRMNKHMRNQVKLTRNMQGSPSTL